MIRTARPGPFGSTIVNPPLLNAMPEQKAYQDRYANLYGFGYHENEGVPADIASAWAGHSGTKLGEQQPFEDGNKLTFKQLLGLDHFDVPDLWPDITFDIRVSENRPWVNASQLLAALKMPEALLIEWLPEALQDMRDDGAIPSDLWPWPKVTFESTPDAWVDTVFVWYLFQQITDDETQELRLARAYAITIPAHFLSRDDERDWIVAQTAPPVLQVPEAPSPDTPGLLDAVLDMPVSQDTDTAREAMDLLMQIAKSSVSSVALKGSTIAKLCGVDLSTQNPMLKPPYVNAPTPLGRAEWHTHKRTDMASLTLLLERKAPELLEWLTEHTIFEPARPTTHHQPET